MAYELDSKSLLRVSFGLRFLQSEEWCTHWSIGLLSFQQSVFRFKSWWQLQTYGHREKGFHLLPFTVNVLCDTLENHRASHAERCTFLGLFVLLWFVLGLFWHQLPRGRPPLQIRSSKNPLKVYFFERNWVGPALVLKEPRRSRPWLELLHQQWTPTIPWVMQLTDVVDGNHFLLSEKLPSPSLSRL